MKAEECLLCHRPFTPKPDFQQGEELLHGDRDMVMSADILWLGLAQGVEILLACNGQRLGMLLNIP